MSLMTVAPLRQLPMGASRYHYRRLRGLGQDDGSDTIDMTDITDMESSQPIISTDYSAPGTAPDVGEVSPTPTFAPEIGPVAPGEITNPITPTLAPSSSETDLAQLILTGQAAPPAGSNLTSAQAQQIAAAGGTAADIQSVISGQSSAAQTLAALNSLAATAGKLATLPMTASGARPSPVTCPTGYTGGVTSTGAATCVISPLAPLEQSSIIPGIPNWILLAAGVIGIGAVAAGASRR